jgi:serine/threonine-protein kinase HipA
VNRKAEIYMFNELAGILKESDSGYEFTYTDNYFNNKKNLPISLTLPLSEQKHTSHHIFPFFDGLIPEGWLLDLIENNWKIDPRDRMGLLLVCCRDCIGSVSVISLEKL